MPNAAQHNRKRVVLVVTGSRAEYGYLYPLLRAIQRSRYLELRLLVTGMHTLRRYGNTINKIRTDRIPIAQVVPVKEKDSMLHALAREIDGIEAHCIRHRPDLLLVIGDRDEAFAGAIVGGHLRIPVAHISGGDTTGYLVDEPIRQSISKFASLHFPSTARSAHNLQALGEEKWRIHISGTLAFDAISQTKFHTRSELACLFGLREEVPWLLILQHPTPLDPVPLVRQLSPTLRAARSIDAERIVIYPNTDTGSSGFIKQIKAFSRTPHVSVQASLSQDVYLSFLAQAAALVGNSSSGMIEAGYFRTPVVDIGGRQKGRECGGNVIHTPYHERQIVIAIHRALSLSFKRRCAATRNPYGKKGASGKIVKILEKTPLDERLTYKRLVS